MSILDRRHRWVLDERAVLGSAITYTCRACGRTETYQAVIPQGFLEEVVRKLRSENLYRTLGVTR